MKFLRERFTCNFKKFHKISIIHSRTGECLNCGFNTGGPKCNRCREGFFGNAVAWPKGQCRTCGCHQNGTYRDKNGDLKCDDVSGVCSCLERVTGPKCDRCLAGTYGMQPGKGCLSCLCKSMGSLSPVCDPITGQCDCKRGVNDRDCSKCAPKHFGMTKGESCRNLILQIIIGILFLTVYV